MEYYALMVCLLGNDGLSDITQRRQIFWKLFLQCTVIECVRKDRRFSLLVVVVHIVLYRVSC